MSKTCIKRAKNVIICAAETKNAERFVLHCAAQRDTMDVLKKGARNGGQKG